MITIRYEEYQNDYHRISKEKTFGDLTEFENWFFDRCDGKYSEKISIPDPDNDIWNEGPSCLEVNCVWTQGITYIVHMITRNGAIIYSDGWHTNRIKHWNELAQNMCRRMVQRRKKPVFNFG